MQGRLSVSPRRLFQIVGLSRCRLLGPTFPQKTSRCFERRREVILGVKACSNVSIMWNVGRIRLLLHVLVVDTTGWDTRCALRTLKP